jgi:alcohol dehydrogenase YqhD (iron-dependent ADH family)
MHDVSDTESRILHKAIVACREYFSKIKTPAAQDIVRMANESEKIITSKMAKANTPLGGSAAANSSASKNLFEMFGISHRLR